MSNRRNHKSLRNYAQYTSLGLQMLVIIFLGVFGGYWLDQFAGTKPLFVILFSLAGVALAIYQAVRDLIKPHQKKDSSCTHSDNSSGNC